MEKSQVKPCTCQRLGESDTGLMRAMLRVFAEAFDDWDAYQSTVPGREYLARLLARQDFIALAAMADNEVVGGLVAYVLEKFEQERKEIYIYDLAVAEGCRRRGIARRLLDTLRAMAGECGACGIYVQADKSDEAAILLYEGVGVKREVFHFDIDL